MPEHNISHHDIQDGSGALNAKTQGARILRLLIDAHGAWVPLPEIMACAAQYNARLLEIRRLGFVIENRTERNDSGVVHSWYRLVSSPPAPAPEPVNEKTPPADSATSKLVDWYERETGKPRSVEQTQANDLPLFIGARQ